MCEEKKPFMFVDIDIGEQEKDRITVFYGDKPMDLAKEFCNKHGFDKDTEETLLN